MRLSQRTLVQFATVHANRAADSTNSESSFIRLCVRCRFLAPSLRRTRLRRNFSGEAPARASFPRDRYRCRDSCPGREFCRMGILPKVNAHLNRPKSPSTCHSCYADMSQRSLSARDDRFDVSTRSTRLNSTLMIRGHPRFLDRYERTPAVREYLTCYAAGDLKERKIWEKAFDLELERGFLILLAPFPDLGRVPRIGAHCQYYRMAARGGQIQEKRSSAGRQGFRQRRVRRRRRRRKTRVVGRRHTRWAESPKCALPLCRADC